MPNGEEDWSKKAIFHTYIKNGEKSCKLAIDGGCYVNVVSNLAMERMNLNPEPHPQPYKVTWVD